MTRLELMDWLEREIAAFPCQTSLLMTDLERGTELLAHRADEGVSAASTIKVPILLTVTDLASRSALSMDQMVPIGTPLEDTIVFEPENLRAEYTLLELLEWMIVNSDNTATNAIIDLIGMEAVNAFCQRLGTKQTILRRKMLDFAAQRAGRDNLTSARDQYLFYSFLTWCARRDPLWQVPLEILERQRSRGSFLRYLPGPIRVAHKTGGLDGVDHDAGVFLDDEHPFYLGIFTWDGPALDGQNQQKRHIAKLTRKVYHWRTGLP